jgi:hypothetical protein
MWLGCRSSSVGNTASLEIVLHWDAFRRECYDGNGHGTHAVGIVGLSRTESPRSRRRNAVEF